jgi:hypothetical protein
VSNQLQNEPSKRRNAFSYALLGGLIAAALDIVYAIVFNGFRGASAIRVLQSVASGLLGSRAYEGGVPVAVLGLVVHFILMLLIATIFFVAARRITLLVRHPVTAGALYGIAVYWVMNLVVLPLSAFPGAFRFVPMIVAANLLVHAFLIGAPIALATKTGLQSNP